MTTLVQSQPTAQPTPRTPSGRSIDELRESLSDRLGELHRRATRTRELLSPITYLANPWVRAGIAVAIGVALLDGRRRSHEGIVHAVVRSGLMAATHVLVTRALAARSAP